MERERIQENLYDLPYHYLAFAESAEVWRVAGGLGWGYKYLAVLEKVLELVVRHQPQRVLDFGCGDGRLIKELLKRKDDLQVVGVDVSRRALAFAQAFCLADSRVKLYESMSDMDPQLLPVDAIVAMEVLEHIPPDELTSVIKQLRNLLRPGGVFVVSVPTINVEISRKHYQHFSLETLLSYIDGLLELVEYHYVHRVGLAWELIRRMVFNRFFIANNGVWLQWATSLYRRFVMHAIPQTGTHLICAFRLTGE